MGSKKAILMSDLLSILISLSPGFLTCLIYYNVFLWSDQTTLSIFIKTTSLLLLPLLFIFCVFIIRLFLPKLKEGRYKMSFNKGFISWALNLALGRAIRIFQLQELIYSSYILKYLYWRAMGANIAFGINSSMYVNLVDISLISVGKGSMLGDEVQLSCHLIQNDHIYLKSIKIGENTFVGINSKIGPGTKIGNNCNIGPWNFLFRHKIKDNDTVKPFTYFQRSDD